MLKVKVTECLNIFQYEIYIYELKNSCGFKTVTQTVADRFNMCVHNVTHV